MCDATGQITKKGKCNGLALKSENHLHKKPDGLSDLSPTARSSSTFNIPCICR